MACHIFKLLSQTSFKNGFREDVLMMYSVSLDEQRRIVAYLDGLPPIRDLRQAKVNELRELQSAGGEELSALMASILDKAFKGEL